MKTLAFLMPFVALAAAQNDWFSGACGQTSFVPEDAQRIVGGKPAKPNTFPWQVMITNYDSLSCGGSIINENWVLTAAHCVSGTMRTSKLVAGAHTTNRRDTSGEDRYLQERTISKAIKNPDYNSWTLNNDAALLKADRPFDLNQAVHPVCSPKRTDDFSSDDATVSGWGTTRSGGRLPSELQYVTVPIITNAECGRDDQYGSSITDGMICAGRVGEREFDACQGDSGGPLVYDAGDHFELIGIVSWGIGCASGYPGVYARVTEYKDWVSSTIRQN